MCQSLKLLAITSAILLSGCASTIVLQKAPIDVEQAWMVEPEKLHVIPEEVIEQNRLDLALPIVVSNYKQFYLQREQLIGLQNTIREFNNEK